VTEVTVVSSATVEQEAGEAQVEQDNSSTFIPTHGSVDHTKTIHGHSEDTVNKTNGRNHNNTETDGRTHNKCLTLQDTHSTQQTPTLVSVDQVDQVEMEVTVVSSATVDQEDLEAQEVQDNSRLAELNTINMDHHTTTDLSQDHTTLNQSLSESVDPNTNLRASQRNSTLTFPGTNNISQSQSQTPAELRKERREELREIAREKPESAESHTQSQSQSQSHVATTAESHTQSQSQSQSHVTTKTTSGRMTTIGSKITTNGVDMTMITTNGVDMTMITNRINIHNTHGWTKKRILSATVDTPDNVKCLRINLSDNFLRISFCKVNYLFSIL